MTNDDRSNDDRTSDGRTPSWGEAPQQSASPDDRPRYGERVDPATAPAPQYGQHDGGQHGAQHGAPSWGDQQHGQQSHQPYAAASAPASAGAPAWQSYDQPSATAQKKRKTVGVIAFFVGLVALVVGIASGITIGSLFTDPAILREAAQGGSQTANQELARQISGAPGAAIGGLLFAVGTVLGLWTIVQGIVAAVTKRGRAWGIWGIVLAVLAVAGVVVAFLAVVSAAAANAGLTS